jgi:hypothetical protein
MHIGVIQKRENDDVIPTTRGQYAAASLRFDNLYCSPLRLASDLFACRLAAARHIKEAGSQVNALVVICSAASAR